MGRANYEKIDGAFANSADDKRWPRPYEEILVSVWRQALVEGARTVTVGDKSFFVRPTSRSRLREVDFQFEDHELRGLEQNPKTTSRWARLAREGKKVMQF
jgi:hypothetical protein